MKRRVLILSIALVGAFVFLTSRGNPMMQRILAPLRANTVAWSGPETVRSASLGSDELNNIDLYKRARLATVK